MTARESEPIQPTGDGKIPSGHITWDTVAAGFSGFAPDEAGFTK